MARAGALWTIRRAVAAALGAAAVATSFTACLIDTSGLSGGDLRDGASADVITSVIGGDGGSDAAGDSAGDSGGIEGSVSTGTTPLFDPGSAWPVSISSTDVAPTTPAFTTSGACTDLLVLANNGNNGDPAVATVASSAGMTFAEVVKDSGNVADAIYIWRATSACAARSGTVTVTWTLPNGGILWGNVVVFAFTHSKGIGTTGSAHSPGSTSINTISITPAASGSWLFASLSGNGGNNATAAGTAGEFVQQFGSEAAVQSYGVSRTPSGSTVGVPVTFSMPTPDDIWANAAVEVLSQ